jgi:hypothetical protein
MKIFEKLQRYEDRCTRKSRGFYNGNMRLVNVEGEEIVFENGLELLPGFEANYRNFLHNSEL